MAWAASGNCPGGKGNLLVYLERIVAEFDGDLELVALARATPERCLVCDPANTSGT